MGPQSVHICTYAWTNAHGNTQLGLQVAVRGLLIISMPNMGTDILACWSDILSDILSRHFVEKNVLKNGLIAT